MGKILSVLEKYKLIEKETEEMPSSENSSENTSYTSSLAAKEQEAALLPIHPEDKEHIEEAASPSPLTAYNRNMSLEDIYALYGLNNCAITDTVFVLENLMNALPSELPEYVKKTTLNNILIASSMNLEKLLTDGTNRYHYLNQFSNDYSTQNTSDIASLKQEIDKLSAIISDYHQQIKQKESMLQNQLTLIKLEEERLQNILNFFNK
ncbi:MAG: hypothetical protein K0S71_848 [Clostridia bacterium]|jgi:hypothetical protein|nr:hypothetical protein [Clostridia bacterium]